MWITFMLFFLETKVPLLAAVVRLWIADQMTLFSYIMSTMAVLGYSVSNSFYFLYTEFNSIQLRPHKLNS
jgi:hypothetical protein